MNEGITFKKTRIAPTPSGFLHLGNILSFVLTTALARKTGARVLLRIDDLDRDRVNRNYVQDIFDTLHFLDIPWDEGPGDFAAYEKEYSQLHRMEMYRQALEQLKESGDVFACTCPRTKIFHHDGSDDVYTGICRRNGTPLDAENVRWRLHTTTERKLAIRTTSSLVNATLPKAMQDFIVRRKDHFPTYQLASVLDDLYYGIDLIVRGEDLWHSTLAQHYLSFSLNQDKFRDITFYHHPLLTDSEDRKLSKSAGDTSVHYLRQQGWKAADIYSRIAGMLGKRTTIGSWEELAEVLGAF
jgi:glutamyl/glutaminyl-tRNA synthetase